MKTVIEIWHKAWPDSGAFVRASAQDLERFAALVAAAERDKWMERTATLIRGEREACAKVCDGLADIHEKMNQWGQHKTAETLAQAIRARGQA